MKFPSNSRVSTRTSAKNDFKLSAELPNFISNPTKSSTKYSTTSWLYTFAIIAIVISITTLFYTLVTMSNLRNFLANSNRLAVNAQRFAFGTGLLHGHSKLWSTVVDTGPDAWIWTGNMMRLDKSLLACAGDRNNNETDCLCQRKLISSKNCTTMDAGQAVGLLQNFLLQRDYMDFLNHLCPYQDVVGYPVPHLACKYTIMSVYGKHDLPSLLNKADGKNLYLDAVGEPRGSKRRSHLHGIEQKYVFNEQNVLKEVSFFLMDDQYYSDSIPCSALRHFCNEMRDSGVPSSWDRWSKYCTTHVETAPCCMTDDLLWDENGFCLERDAESFPNYKELCDATHVSFGKRLWNFNEQKKYIVPSEYGISSFCEIFGITQRNWLSEQLSKSKSRVNIIVTSIPLFQNISDSNTSEVLLGDAWKYHKAAQQNILSLIGRSAASCVVFISGGDAQAEIKVFQPYLNELTPEHLSTANLKTPIYQIISGGLTSDMMETWKQRLGSKSNRCGSTSNCIFGEPNFGMVDIDWDKHSMNLQVRYTKDGSIAINQVVNLHDCTSR